MKQVIWCYILCLESLEVISLKDYYWREYYFNHLPVDAVPGGQNNDTAFYVGKVFIANYGLFPTKIIPDEVNVEVGFRGIRKTQEFVWILCSQRRSSFKWVKTKQATFNLTAATEFLVNGGIESGRWLKIGRIKYKGVYQIGKVLQNEGKMYFVHGQREYVSKCYEVLAFE
ncbi:uncharacterized protein LOC132703829 [Cylas formicarius]|uniref:uncharacterized protein LOC132703829 n=1 Tax=Cylas formicarius TaxID=197179 RepID=UPI0029587B2B|nr:uncharacterized protein LOC132703829 [Cylas formicarius]